MCSYYRLHGRAMPWRDRRSPYRVFVSEIMLQQTSVPMVTPRYGAFLKKFPSFKALAASSVAEVIRAWKGLGYNRRALALLQSARIVTSAYRGRLPRSIEELVGLPGVGPATAAAVMVYAFNIPVAFIETNVRRVFIHFFFPGEEKVPDSRILPLVEQTMDRENPREWFYALMDYGTFLAGKGVGRRQPSERGTSEHGASEHGTSERGTPERGASKRPASDPLRRSSRYRRQRAFEGSHRQLRGRILQLMLENRLADLPAVQAALGEDPRLQKALEELVAEGFLEMRAGLYSFR